MEKESRWIEKARLKKQWKTKDSTNKKTGNIHNFLFKNCNYNIFEKKINGVKIQLDIDPISMM